LDPVEKKPFFHALPGSLAMSFGMLGCDFHCGYCQNWVTSQALRDPNAIAPPHQLTPGEFVTFAVNQGARIVTSTYNEPLITSEWAVEIFKVARKAGLKTSYVSNGNGTPEVLEYIKPWVDLYKVDLKSFQDRSYRKLGGLLNNVLDTIQRLYAMGFCFGGAISYLQAASGLGYAGVIGFYGWPLGLARWPDRPKPIDAVARYKCSVLSLFGGADAGIPQSAVDEFDAACRKANIKHDSTVYPGAPHSFFDRKQTEFAEASADAWKRVQAFVRQNTKA
jgi:acetyl esterase/lipase